jgi:CMP-N-acetylneuraminic acid synthetase
MKVTALIPFWVDYRSLDNSINDRPLVDIGGKSLISRTIETINHVELVDEVVVFSSSDKICDFISEGAIYKFVKRDKKLDSEKASIEDVIDGFIKKSNTDIILLVHPKSPFIKSTTMQECVEQVVSGKFDSAFVANSIKKHVWFQGEPLNYSRSEDTPALSKIDPILVETCSVYVFTRSLFENTRHRIGEDPYIKEIGHFEGLEVDRLDDFEMAELIINAGLDKERL